MRIRLTQLDGKLPNLALMNLHAWANRKGFPCYLTRSVEKVPGEGDYDAVFGSAIFKFSAPTVKRFVAVWPGAVVGGTGTESEKTVAELIAPDRCESVCYDGYPEFLDSIGFTQRGCRLNCGFCVVPKKEGKPVVSKSIWEIWRGDPYPRNLHLLDNDFFGVPEWRRRIEEIKRGNFRVCLSQGINVRMISEPAAKALASIEYRDTAFKCRRLYTAWDNLKDEHAFFRGIDRLERAGIPPRHLLVYMLIGYDPEDTWKRIWNRFNRMVLLGIRPFPMLYDRSRSDLKCFQRWVIRGLYRIVPWNEYKRSTKTEESVEAWQNSLSV